MKARVLLAYFPQQNILTMPMQLVGFVMERQRTTQVDVVVLASNQNDAGLSMAVGLVHSNEVIVNFDGNFSEPVHP